MTTLTAHGASPDTWEHFSKRLQLTSDLLPVVSNPGATISAKSKMSELGKTPSRYNPQGEAVGIPDWTQAFTTEHQVRLWQREADYGIALQTRTVRALDVDVADPVHSRELADVIESVLGRLPTRARGNSGKLLLAFSMPGEFNKRIIRTEHGMVEFLATGQQFIAAGRHPSGVHYEWLDGLPAAFPEVTPAEFEALWQGLKDLYALDSAEFTTGARPSMPRSALDMHGDPVVAWLQENNWVREFDRDGRVHVTCPWEDQHTTDSGPTATSYFPAGVGGFASGGFRCLHAHCSAQHVGHFLQAVGYEASLFEDVSVPQKADTACADAGAPAMNSVAVFESEEPWPVFTRDKKGKIDATADNAAKAIARPDIVLARLGYDKFKDTIMVAHEDEPQWRPLRDTDYFRLRVQMERRGFASAGSDLVREAVHRVAEVNAFDSAVQWAEGLSWDGQERIDTFFIRYFGAPDTSYVRAVGRYLWTALAGRALVPGVKADMVPVLVSGEGTGKTSSVEALAPESGAFLELNLEVRDDNLARSLRGKLVAELAELRGLRGRDSEAIKSWVTRRKEEWVPKYREFATEYLRRFIPIGTTNEPEILDDQTGDRRWLPVSVAPTQDVEAIRRDRDQLWAEGVVAFQLEGVAWQDAQALAVEAREEYKIGDEWEEIVAHWLLRDGMDGASGPARGAGTVKSKDILASALGFDMQKVGRREELRVSKILRKFGFAKVDTFVNGVKARGWTPGPACTLNFARS